MDVQQVTQHTGVKVPLDHDGVGHPKACFVTCQKSDPKLRYFFIRKKLPWYYYPVQKGSGFISSILKYGLKRLSKYKCMFIVFAKNNSSDKNR